MKDLRPLPSGLECKAAKLGFELQVVAEADSLLTLNSMVRSIEAFSIHTLRGPQGALFDTRNLQSQRNVRALELARAFGIHAGIFRDGSLLQHQVLRRTDDSNVEGRGRCHADRIGGIGGRLFLCQPISRYWRGSPQGGGR